ncbi:phosphatidate cytidylyltransferase [Povalibacter sp.]|uniref:phosphatidate cytidylyltransferase n=1 Tax=Povalibacter sp. TaxID=1962978 RepID=UPI002F3E9E2C
MLRQRIITALVLAPLALLVVLWVPHQVTMAVFAVLVLAGAWEWAAFPGFVSNSARIAYMVAVAAALAACWWMGPEQIQWVLYAAMAWWLIALFWIAFLPTYMNRVLGMVAGFLVLVPAWVALVWLHDLNPHLVLFVVLLVVAADVGAYFGGRKFGRHKLAPRVSPGKTWEGVAGGLVAAALLAAIGVVWFDFSAIPFLIVSAVVVVASVVGDLTESLFKRHAGLKDSGSLLPGHGGVLDRVDSVTAAAPVFLVGLEFLGRLA